MKRKLKFRVVYGYNAGQHVTVRKKDLPKLYVMFLNGTGRTVLENGIALRGEDIQRIEPDWNATMDWNATYRLMSDDFDQIGFALQEEAKQIMGEKREIAHYLIRSGQEDKASLPMADMNQYLPEALQKKLLLN